MSLSVSRVMNDIADGAQIEAAQKFRQLVSLYLENRDLILMGGYTPGQDPDLDLAVGIWPQLWELIQQNGADKAEFGVSRNALVSLMGGYHGRRQEHVPSLRAEAEGGRLFARPKR